MDHRACPEIVTPSEIEGRSLRGAQSMSLIVLLSSLFLASCTPTVPYDALSLGPQSLQMRQLQSRRFDTTDERQLLIAAASLLQDMGFQIDESESRLGILVGSKNLDMVDRSVIIGGMIIGALLETEVVMETEQKVRVSIATRPSGSNTVLRATFQRVVWNTENEISRQEPLKDPTLYRDFFDRLSKAVFLEAHYL